ncbi:MAG: hypothetical protein EBR30_22215 [Cytophagia bacterium]|nr:hypothetical protein [Cytophagia bacterium]NBW37682.1 hypothetical protein [Cytophagia bacterium]
MEGYLDQAKIDYVLFHLKLHVKVDKLIDQKLCFIDYGKAINFKNSIVFQLSPKGLNTNHILGVGDLPILFPNSDSLDFFTIDQNQNIVFTHDFLKSIFYLLSGYQEYIDTASKDNLGRFSFQDSIQCKLNVIEKALVNHYFDKIVDGLELFCAHHKISIERKRPFKTIGLLLTHDIDYVDKFTYNYWIYKLKEIFKIRPSKLSFDQNIILLIKGFLNYIGFSKKNPFWNFKWIRDTQKKYNWKSTFYFLDQGVKNSDAFYSFNEPRLLSLFEYLKNDGCEIGLHGRVGSVTDRLNMEESLAKLSHASKANIIGIRQHRLLWKHPTTALIQASLGFKYDTTLGFAAHQGFRNSYCFPFRIFDFEKNTISSIWELPLNVMDVTLFAYQNYSTSQALEACERILLEVNHFGGLFTLLWHNSFFDEDTYPGITEFYLALLEKIAAYNPHNDTGIEITNYIEKFRESND